MSNEQRNGFVIKGDSEAWRQVEHLGPCPDGAGAWMGQAASPAPEAEVVTLAEAIELEEDGNE